MLCQNCFEASIANFASMVTGNYTYCSCHDDIYTFCSRKEKTTEKIWPKFWVGYHLCFHRKGKSLWKNFAFFAKKSASKISHFLLFVRLRKMRNVRFFRKILQKMQTFREKINAQIFGGKNCKKYGRDIIDYGMIKLLMLSSQSREFHKCFWRN